MIQTDFSQSRTQWMVLRINVNVRFLQEQSSNKRMLWLLGYSNFKQQKMTINSRSQKAMCVVFFDSLM